MTKIAVICDSHWGVRGDNVHFLDMNKRFLENVFFPTIDEQRIKCVLHLGDVVDKRKQISFQTANCLRKDFLEPLADRGVRTIVTVGNHDCFYKNTNKINALTELVQDKYTNFEVLIDPTEMELYNQKILMLPWICQENQENSMRMINETNASICLGHLEIEGFEMYKGLVNEHGKSRQLFDKFHMVLSGHYHHVSSDGSINYLGSHGEFTWSDYNDPRGFHILDLQKKDLTFCQNPYTMFSKIWYDDNGKELKDLLATDFSLYQNKIVKLIVQNKTNPYWFDRFCEKLESTGLINLQIVEDHLNLNVENPEDIVDEAQSTIDIFRKHISQISDFDDNNRSKLETLIVELYNNAITVE